MILHAYAVGVFPMANDRADAEVYWIAPVERGILPLDTFHVPHRLRREIRRSPAMVTVDQAFAEVIAACAAPRPGHPATWINADIAQVFTALHRMGHAHSIEVWDGQTLVGGLYGLAMGGAFFGESMFSHATNASKIALVHLVARLRYGGFVLLDTQFVTDHLRQFGAIEIAAALYRRRLREALAIDATFYSGPLDAPLTGALESLLTQSNTQTS